jgi:hypothetical protein
MMAEVIAIACVWAITGLGGLAVLLLTWEK